MSIKERIAADEEWAMRTRPRVKNDGVEYALPAEIFVKPEDDVDGPWLNASEDVNDFAAAGGEVMVGRYVLASVEVITAPVTLRMVAVGQP